MAAHAGETARETADFRRAKCHEQAYATKAEAIPRCPDGGPDGGNDALDARRHEPGNQSS